MAPKTNRKSIRKTGNIDKAVKRALMRIAEPKVFSTQAAGNLISSSGTVINLSNGIVEGDGINNRSGTVVTITKQNLRFNFEAFTVTQSARVILFRDMMNGGSTPSVTDVLPATGYLSHYSDVREIQQARFDILWDVVIDCNLNGEATKTLRKVASRPKKVFYNGTTAVASANGKGSIFLLVIGSASTGVYDWDWQAVFNDS